MANALSICSAALLMIGADEITSFDDDSRAAKLCSSLYGTTRDELLQAYPWRFAIGQSRLAQLVATPLFGYRYAYQLPADILRMIATAEGAPYSLQGGRLYTDMPAMEITYLYRPDENHLPAYFIRAVELKLAEILAVALQEDLNKSTLMAQKAREQIVRARAVDAQQQPAQVPAFNQFSLAAVRE